MDIKRIHCMLEKLTEWANSEFDKGKESVNTCEMGQVIDMIKDLSCAYKDRVEGKMKNMELEALEDMKKMEESGEFFKMMMADRAGYDNWRYSSGRFAPKGRGHFAGFTPYMDPWMMEGMPEEYRMGYSGGSGSDGGNSGGGQGGGGNSRGGYGGRYSSESRGMPRGGRMGYPGEWYEEYMDNKRHYTETRNPEDKMKMDESAKHHMEESMETMKEIWKDADPTLRKKMREDLTRLINEMPA